MTMESKLGTDNIVGSKLGMACINGCTYVYLGDNMFKVIRLDLEDYTFHYNYIDPSNRRISQQFKTTETIESSSDIIKALYPGIYPYLENPYIATFLILSHNNWKRFYQPKIECLEIRYTDNEVEHKILIDHHNLDEIYLSIGDDIKNLAINPKELINFL